jgi:hypothetical protein
LFGIGLAQSYKIIEYNDKSITIEVNFHNKFIYSDTTIGSVKFTKIMGNTPYNRIEGEPLIPQMYLSFGIPHSSKPTVEIKKIEQDIIKDKFLFPVPSYDENGNIISITDFNKEIYSQNSNYPENDIKISADYISRYSRIINVQIAPFKFNPVRRELTFNKTIKFTLYYNEINTEDFEYVLDKKNDEFLKTSVVNYETAIKWSGKKLKSLQEGDNNNYWYNPNKEYFKIYLSQKGVYRITYEDLVEAGLIVNKVIKSKKMELYCNGVKIPIDIDTKKDSIFTYGSYFQFCGYPPAPTPYSKLNIYNKSNVYWFSYEADSVGYSYKDLDGKPLVWGKSYATNKRVIHYERDTLYENFGYAENSNRDYWQWGKASGKGGDVYEAFFYTFPSPLYLSPDSLYFTLRVGLHGVSVGQHKADISLTSQPIGSKIWSGQQEAYFEKTFKIGDIGIYPSNTFQVFAKGEFEQDEIRVNWFEIEYWQNNSVYGDNFIFTSPENTFGKTKFIVYRWTADTMLVYIPSRGEIIRNSLVTHNQWDNVEFVDQVFIPTEYFCVSLTSFLKPDSIVKNINSDLRNVNQGADYLIITHPKFTEAANRLANFRSMKLTGFTSARAKVVNVLDIYNEFSYGLLNPFAIRDFIQYVFEKWQRPAPSYVVLMGDMSHDYRKIRPESRENYIPSIPYQSFKYGQAASDNMFVAVAGTDVMPDISIGRLSCETLEEANTLVDKIMAYPSDFSKEWRQRVNLYSAGQNANDENYFKFNDENTLLNNNYIFPKGYSSYRVFTFPNVPEYQQFYGGTNEMKEGFNNGAVITNFFGHGGGYQWDLFFLNDHIYQLTNGGKQPFITSITCYTAHFDNQDVFGEQFIKVPGKGAIGFWGHTGITFWPQGKSLNSKLYNEIFAKNNFVIGDAIRFAKNNYVNGMTGLEADHVALLTLLGDPAIDLAFVRKPDFKIMPEYISMTPDAPLIDENVLIKVNILNLGTIFPNDSVSVKVFISSVDTSYSLDAKYLKSFGENDSIFFNWVPKKAGLYSVKVELNKINTIDEEDLSDNVAEKSIAVYNVKETNIIYPENGIVIKENKPKFIIADPGIYLNKNYSYFIEIDTSKNFTNPLVKSPELFGNKGIVEWHSNINLSKGVYFWRSRIKDLEQVPYWSNLSTFTISDSSFNGLSRFSEKQLLLFNTNNLNYNENNKSLELNLKKLPPRPSNTKFIEDIFPDSVDGLQSYSAFTTDGTYLYVSHMAYYAGPSKIYKFGTGENGTEKGKYYGDVPCDSVKVWNSMFYYNGYIFVSADMNPYQLKKIDPVTGIVDSVHIPSGLLDVYACKPIKGAYYVKTDGRYVYNLTVKDTVGQDKYVLRILDPENGFNKVVEDKYFTGTAYSSFTDFFAAAGYIYAYEKNISGFMRRLNIETTEFEDIDWLPFVPYQGYYSWTYDYQKDLVYGSVYHGTKIPKFSKFVGTYYQTYGSAKSPEVSNVKKWKKAEYTVNSQGSNGYYYVNLEGFETSSNSWKSIADSVGSSINLNTLDANKYKSLRYHFFFSDTSQSITNPLQLKAVNFYYEGLPEIQISNASIHFSPDTLMQGFPIEMHLEAKNLGSSTADSVKFSFRLNEVNNPFYVAKIKIPADSTGKINYTINTSKLLFTNKVKVEGNVLGKEMYTFNNVGSNTFFVSRDSINPTFDIKFDGEDIINGDIISAKPTVLMTLKDNSPLPLDSTFFYVYHNNVQVSKDSLRFSYTPYPNSTAYLTWTPTLRDGNHYLEILARDASLNYFDTTAYKVWFVVSNKNELKEIYNYPNPFTEGTYFTFNMTGTQKPEEIKIKIYTIAGRLIKNLEIPTEPLKFGFNKFYWNGKDEDGDEIGNGVYFYKIIITENGITKTETKKIVKLK